MDKQNLIQNNTFNGIVWDGQAIEALVLTAKALLNLTEIFKSQHIQIESLLKVGDTNNIDSLINKQQSNG